MNEMKMMSLPWGGNISLYAFWVVLGALVACVWTVYRAHKYGAGEGGAVFFSALSGALGLFLGRAIYCGVRFNVLFYDPMGDFVGFAPFVDLNQGGVSVIGVIFGVLLAALLAGAVSGKGKALALLDSAAVPGLALFAWARFVEPLSGLGFGDVIENEAFCRFPFAIENSWGDYCLSVCFIEAVLAALLALTMLIAGRFCRKKGTVGGIALALLCVSQIMPESLRHDDVLLLFIFARVSQMGYAVLLAGTLAAGLIRGGKRGLNGKTMVLEIVLLLLGLGILIGAEFALDKTNWPDAAVYAGMIATLLALGFLVVRRLAKEDRVLRDVPNPTDVPEDGESAGKTAEA
jgi:prolipoprotein diacylglyceryltransferase